MSSTHRLNIPGKRKLSVKTVHAVLEQEAIAWSIARSIRWGYGKRPSCPRCGRVSWADDSRLDRKRWECQNCPSNVPHRRTTKFSDAVGTPFDRTAQSLALAFLCFAFGPTALSIIRRAGISPQVIPNEATLSEDHWHAKALFQAIKQVAMRIHSHGYDLAAWIDDLEGQQAQDDAKTAQAIQRKYLDQISALAQQAETLRMKMREELRSLRRYTPHHHLRKAA